MQGRAPVSARSGEIILAGVLLAICIGAWWLSAGFTSRSSMVQTLSPALFPRIVLFGLMCCSVGLLVRAVTWSGVWETVTWGHFGRVSAVVAIMLLQAALFDELGALPTIGAGLLCVLLVARVPWKKAAAVAAGFVLFLYVFFVLLLRVSLPMEFLPTLTIGG